MITKRGHLRPVRAKARNAHINVMRQLPFAIVISCALGLAACSSEETEPEEAVPTSPAPSQSEPETADGESGGTSGSAPEDGAPEDGAPGGGGSEEETASDIAAAAQGATPMAERVATIGLLNKRNNVSVDLEMRPGETREEGPVIITLAACERTAPWEMPQETGAFVQVDVLERGQDAHSRAFSGWLFKRSPSLNVVEHPIYDVWVKDCAMRFPGDEA